MGTAHADPAAPAPVPNVGEQLANTAVRAPQMLQNLATALGAPPPVPQTPPPLASAAISVPQPGTLPGTPVGLPGTPAAMPGMTSVLPGATTGLPATTSVIPGATTTVPAAGSNQLLPSAKVDLPQLPFLPVPLPQQVSFPGDLLSIASGGMPGARGATPPATVAAAAPGAAPAAARDALLLPLSGLP
ncbi:hypothetical protein MBOT_23670 [Mycobacterium botniense]|uniref:Uncharacterized protein n=2 Tax=Mycobacterium botniense TaxID=84962 RepID=A0A7I9XYV4_9MYCO|nr:hypothetical protein MBOT_23670 [Mycobacterium botniense]